MVEQNTTQPKHVWKVGDKARLANTFRDHRAGVIFTVLEISVLSERWGSGVGLLVHGRRVCAHCERPYSEMPWLDSAWFVPVRPRAKKGKAKR